MLIYKCKTKASELRGSVTPKKLVKREIERERLETSLKMKVFFIKR